MLALLVLAGPLLSAPPAFAQENGQGFWLLRKLFAPRKAERLEPRREAPAKRTKRKTQPRPPAEPAIQAVSKDADAKVIVVIGDFLAGGLAEGLTAVYAEDPKVRVLDRANGSSGFVRSDVVDWPTAIGGIIEAEKPAAVVIMLGSNDRQQMRVGDKREPALSAPWLAEYTRRTEALAAAAKQSRVPMLWVGMPPFKFANMNSDMLAFNEIYREASEGAGGEFVDVWDGFVDESGSYVPTGPDINGQPVRLRANDGINMTRAGRRKIAFYLEKPLARILGLGSGADGIASLAPALPSEVPIDPASIVRTQPIALTDPELDGGFELLGAPGSTNARGGAGLRMFASDAKGAQAVEGRADASVWPPRPAAAAAIAPAAAAAGPDQPLAIAR